LSGERRCRTFRSSRCTIPPLFTQEEDCIRSLYVTGVQTCALPIYQRDGADGRRRHHHVDRRGGRRLAGGVAELERVAGLDAEIRDRKSVGWGWGGVDDG